MNPNLVIYEINQRPDTLKAWRDLDADQKREVLKECERREVDAREIELIIREVVEGQRRLF